MNITLLQIPADNTYKPQFFKGETYLTEAGRIVTITEDTAGNFPEGSHYHCVKGDDNKWRYYHSGRCTGRPLVHFDNLTLEGKS